jgi:hypothetical protein
MTLMMRVGGERLRQPKLLRQSIETVLAIRNERHESRTHGIAVLRDRTPQMGPNIIKKREGGKCCDI